MYAQQKISAFVSKLSEREKENSNRERLEDIGRKLTQRERKKRHKGRGREENEK